MLSKPLALFTDCDIHFKTCQKTHYHLVCYFVHKPFVTWNIPDFVWRVSSLIFLSSGCVFVPVEAVELQKQKTLNPLQYVIIVLTVFLKSIIPPVSCYRFHVISWCRHIALSITTVSMFRFCSVYCFYTCIAIVAYESQDRYKILASILPQSSNSHLSTEMGVMQTKHNESWKLFAWFLNMLLFLFLIKFKEC